MILHSIEPLIPSLRSVRIDTEATSNICRTISPAHLKLPTWRESIFPAEDDEQTAEFMLTVNTINFSYWGTPKWTVEHNGCLYDGAFGLFAAFTKALAEGIPITDGRYLANLSSGDLSCILRGNVEIPMFEERLTILREVGRTLLNSYKGRFLNVIRSAQGSAPNLVRRLVEDFLSFNDTVQVDGRIVAFHKRAQLGTAMLIERFGGKRWGALEGLGTLTVYADYKLPQVLRRLGILSYSDDLSQKVDTCTDIPAGSREEVEIRMATVWAGELMKRTLSDRFPGITAAHIDYYLWSEGQNHPSDGKPYHRTRTIYY
jgi:hypothetical protein